MGRGKNEEMSTSGKEKSKPKEAKGFIPSSTSDKDEKSKSTIATIREKQARDKQAMGWDE